MDIVTTYKLSFSAKGGWLSKGAPLELQTVSRASLHISQKNLKKITNVYSDYITKRESPEARMNLQVAQSKLHEADKSTARPHGQTRETPPEKQAHKQIEENRYKHPMGWNSAKCRKRLISAAYSGTTWPA